MAEGNSTPQGLNLEEILRTLASLPSNQHATQAGHAQPLDTQPPTAQNELVRGSLTSAPNPPLSSQERPLDPNLHDGPPRQQHTVASRPRPQPSMAKAIIDPATITDWRHGLRCVNKIAALNPNFETTIRKLIQRQERSLKEWEIGRTRLIEEQRVKRENEETQRAAISIPGLLADVPVLRTPDVDKEELDQFHRKVYRASCQMVQSQSRELQLLGVPFFGVRPDLILLDNANAPSTDEAGLQPREDIGRKISKKQLLELQRKMLNYLMDLYSE